MTSCQVGQRSDEPMELCSRPRDGTMNDRVFLDVLRTNDAEFRRKEKESRLKSVSWLCMVEDAGFMSEVYKVTVNFEDGSSLAFCLKHPISSKMDEITHMDFYPFLVFLHNRECRFYRDLQCTGLKLPRVYGLKELHDDDHDGYIVMQLLNGRAPCMEQSLTEAQLFSVAEQLARLHAFSLDHPEWGQDAQFQPFCIGADDAQWTAMWTPIHEYLQSLPAVYQLIRKLERVYKRHNFVQYAVHDAHVQLGLPSLLSHGDLWGSNLFFNGDQVEAFIDWQAVNAGNPTQDLVRLLVLNCSAEVRRGCERRVLAHYLRSLRRFAATPPAFDVERLQQAARPYYFYQLFLGFYLATHRYSTPRFQQSRHIFVERVRALLEDALLWLRQNPQWAQHF